MDHDAYPDEYLERILARTHTIAMVGASADPRRPSNEVMRFLQARGYRILPINPTLGREILGERVYATLADVPVAFDLVDVFRSSDAAGGVVDEALAVAQAKGVTTIWMQIGVRDDAAARRAEAQGIEVVMDRCPKLELMRLRPQSS